MLSNARRVSGSLGSKWPGAAWLSTAFATVLLITPVQAADMLYACFPNDTGKVRIVGSLAECKTSETGISWNIQGPEGEPGPQGATGPQGPAGEVTEAQFLELEARILALEEGGGGGGVPGGGGAKRVFVTCKAYAPLGAPDPDCSSGDEFCVPQDGFFNSVADADALCQGIAKSVGLTNGAEGSPNFIAWLSSKAGVSPNARFDQTAGPYVNIGNQMIATDWIDLTDGSLLIPISNDELNRERQDIGVWTGTSFDGSPTLCDCGSWVGVAEDNCDPEIYPFMSLAGTIGDSTASNENWTDFSIPIEFTPGQSRCDEPRALYCFEQ